ERDVTISSRLHGPLSPSFSTIAFSTVVMGRTPGRRMRNGFDHVRCLHLTLAQGKERASHNLLLLLRVRFLFREFLARVAKKRRETQMEARFSGQQARTYQPKRLRPL